MPPVSVAHFSSIMTVQFTANFFLCLLQPLFAALVVGGLPTSPTQADIGIFIIAAEFRKRQRKWVASLLAPPRLKPLPDLRFPCPVVSRHWRSPVSLAAADHLLLAPSKSHPRNSSVEQ